VAFIGQSGREREREGEERREGSFFSSVE